MTHGEAKGGEGERRKGDRAGRMLRRSLLLVPTHTRVLHNKQYMLLRCGGSVFGRAPVPVPGCAFLRPPGAPTSHKAPALLPNGKI